MRAIIFANGRLTDVQGTRNLLRADDLIIAVDGGTRHAWEVGVDPERVIGDLDSLTPAERERVRSGGAQIISFPARKDETDLELALLRAASEGAESIVVLAALGGRLDQTIANLLLLALPELDGIDIRVVEGPQVAFLIRDEALIEGQPGDTVSLIPLGGDAGGISTEGLEWGLDGDTLHFGPARGVSNVLTVERASVRVRQGLLLCVVTHANE
ncbi:MAG: thiamine diphosphokinase [Anaerolineae bacterium]|jgi:thiamine pyrophosphokinase